MTVSTSAELLCVCCAFAVAYVHYRSILFAKRHLINERADMGYVVEETDVFDKAVATSITKGLSNVASVYGGTAYLDAALGSFRDAGMPMSVFSVACVVELSDLLARLRAALTEVQGIRDDFLANIAMPHAHSQPSEGRSSSRSTGTRTTR